MKKRVIAVVVVIALMAVILTSCNLFTINEERDYNQVLASLSYDGMTAEITKGEFLEYYTQNAPYYLQSGWTALTCVENFLPALAKREIILMEAKKKYSSETVSKNETDLMKFLNEDERKWVIDRTNKQFKDIVDKDVKTTLSEKYSNIKNDEDALAARTQKAEKDKYENYKDGIMSDVEKVDKYFDEFDSNKDNLIKEEIKAVEDLKKDLEKSRKSYDYYLQQQAKSRLLNKYQKDYGKDISVTDEEITNKYNFNVNDQEVNKFLTDSAYTTALSGSDPVLYHRGEYVKVKSILLKFSESQEAIYTALKSAFSGDEKLSTLHKYRDVLVNGFNGNTDKLPLAYSNKDIGLRVNISNPDYDPDAICRDESCSCPQCVNNPDNAGKDYEDYLPCKIDREQVDENGYLKEVDGCPCVSCINNAYTKYNVPYQKVLDMINEAVYKAGVEAANEYYTKYPNGNDLGKQLYLSNARTEAFNDQIYLFNDDSGMFEGKDYIGTPDNKSSDYVGEYTALLRALIKTNGVTGGTMKAGSDKYTVGGIEYPIYTKTTNIKNEAGETIGSESMSYVINDFGVHIVMVTSMPVDKTINKDIEGAITEKTVSVNGKQETHYILGANAIIGFDEETGLPMTVFDTYKKSMEESKQTSEYTAYQNKFFKDLYGDDMFAEENKAKGISLNKGIYNQIIKWTGADKEESKK